MRCGKIIYISSILWLGAFFAKPVFAGSLLPSQNWENTWDNCWDISRADLIARASNCVTSQANLQQHLKKICPVGQVSRIKQLQYGLERLDHYYCENLPSDDNDVYTEDLISIGANYCNNQPFTPDEDKQLGAATIRDYSNRKLMRLLTMNCPDQVPQSVRSRMNQAAENLGFSPVDLEAWLREDLQEACVEQRRIAAASTGILGSLWGGLEAGNISSERRDAHARGEYPPDYNEMMRQATSRFRLGMAQVRLVASGCVNPDRNYPRRGHALTHRHGSRTASRAEMSINFREGHKHGNSPGDTAGITRADGSGVPPHNHGGALNGEIFETGIPQSFRNISHEIQSQTTTNPRARVNGLIDHAQEEFNSLTVKKDCTGHNCMPVAHRRWAVSYKDPYYRYFHADAHPSDERMLRRVFMQECHRPLEQGRGPTSDVPD